MGKYSPYLGKVNVPCRKCHSFVRAGIQEKILVCPVCNTKWG